jgi:RHS repeat-associated protein
LPVKGRAKIPQNGIVNQPTATFTSRLQEAETSVATGNSSYNLAFSFDRYGNMTCSQNQNTNGPCPQYSFNFSTNQISNSGYTYDVSGDLTGDGAHTYQYDAEGRLISVDNGSTASYVYNALGERVEKDVAGTYTEYVFDKDGNPVGENNRTTWTDTWVIFNGQHVAHYENGETYFMHANSVGTAAFVTDYSGAVVQDELHYPWGEEWTMQGTMEEERFASLQHRDSETALDPTNYRMYSSSQYRWFTPDPLQADIFNPQSMSRYSYAGGNPSNRVDPSGGIVMYAPEEDWRFSDADSWGGGGGGYDFLYDMSYAFAAAESYGDALWIPVVMGATSVGSFGVGAAAIIGGCALGGPVGCGVGWSWASLIL